MNLNLENIDDLFLDSLETMEITPSPSVKQNVKKRMFYRNIIKGTYFKIVSASIILLILSLVFFFNTDNNTKGNNIAKNQDSNYSTTNNLDLAQETPKYKKESIDNNTNKISPTTNKNKSNVETNVNKYDEENTLINSNNVEKNNINKPNTNEINNINSNKKTNQKNAIKNTISQEDKSITNNKTANTNLASSSINNYTSSSKLKSNPNYFTRINQKSFIKLSNENKLFIPEINIPDDTVAFTAMGEEIILSSNHWFVGLNFSPNYNKINYTVSNNENNNLVDKLKSSSNNNLAYSFGADIGYNFKNISLISGINYTQFNEKFNAEYEEINIKQINYWEYNNSTQTIYDTTNYINIDSLMQGDTTYVQIIDSTEITVTDSSLASENDTSITNKNMKYINKYKYIEIPLIIEYTFNRANKISPFIRTGLITGLHIKTQGFTYSTQNNQQLIENTDLPYIKANFWLLFGAGINYKLNDKFSVLVYPYYRYHLNSIIADKTYYRQSLNNMGINFGFRYKF